MTRAVVARADATPVERVFREAYGQAVATLIRIFGDITLAEDAVQDAFVVASDRWRRDGIPPNPAGWIVTTARNRAIDDLRRSARGRELHEQLGAVAATSRDPGAEESGRGRTRDGRSTPADLHLLPPGAATGAPRGPDPPAPRRPERGRGGPLVPGERAGDGEAARPSEVQDQGREDPLSGAGRRGPAVSARVGPVGPVPDLQHRARQSGTGFAAEPRRSGSLVRSSS